MKWVVEPSRSKTDPGLPCIGKEDSQHTRISEVTFLTPHNSLHSSPRPPTTLAPVAMHGLVRQAVGARVRTEQTETRGRGSTKKINSFRQTNVRKNRSAVKHARSFSDPNTPYLQCDEFALHNLHITMEVELATQPKGSNDNWWQMKRQQCWAESCSRTHSMSSSASPSTIMPSISLLKFLSAIWVFVASASHCESAAPIFLWHSWLAKKRPFSWTHGPTTVSKSSKNAAR